jgi:hypothetical protein
MPAPDRQREDAAHCRALGIGSYLAKPVSQPASTEPTAASLAHTQAVLQTLQNAVVACRS